MERRNVLTAIRPILEDLRPQRRASRVLYAFGALWLTSALVHTVILAGTGFEWSGSVSWRKPIVFGLSVGLLLATVGWVLDRLPDRRRLAGVIAWTLGLSSSVEVGLITVQAWRGEASHFNVFEGTNALLFSLMGAMVGVMSLCLIAVLVWAAIRRPADALLSWAVLAGMVLVVGGLGIGQWLIELGNDFAAANGIVPETVTYGASGTPKFPHAIAFHGIQVFIVSALALRRAETRESRRIGMMRTLVASYTAILMFASVQSIVGVAPTGISIWTGLLALSAAVTVGVLVAIARIYAATPRSTQREMAGVS